MAEPTLDEQVEDLLSPQAMITMLLSMNMVRKLNNTEYNIMYVEVTNF